MGIAMVGSRPTTHHNNTATASEAILRARFFRTYLRKKLRGESSIALALRSFGKVLVVAQALDLALVGRQFAVRNGSRQRSRRYISPQHFAQAFAQVLDRDVTLDLSAYRNADGTGLFRHHHRDGVGLFRNPDGGAVASAKLGGEHGIHGERQEAGSRCNTPLLHNDGAVVQRRARAENSDQ